MQQPFHSLKQRLTAFIADESGAATIDWVVLTSASVGLGIAVMGKVEQGVENLANDIATHLSSIEIVTTFEGRNSSDDDPQ